MKYISEKLFGVLGLDPDAPTLEEIVADVIMINFNLNKFKRDNISELLEG